MRTKEDIKHNDYSLGIFGINVSYSKNGDKIEGKDFQVRTTASWNERQELARIFAKSGAPAIVPNAFGSWFRSLAALKQAGVKAATIVIPRNQNFLATSKRTAIVIKEANRIFLPIYKNGTSSFRALAYAYFKEFAQCDPMDSTSLNSTIDPLSEKFSEYQSFTFVRQPMDRFGSFFRDKILSDENSFNFQQFVEPITILMDKELTAKTLAEFIKLIPPEYCDPHIKPQWMTIFHQKKKLVNNVFRLGDPKALQNMEIPFEFPKKLSTRHRVSLYEKDETLSDAENLIKEFYRRDYRIWREVRMRDFQT